LGQERVEPVGDTLSLKDTLIKEIEDSSRYVVSVQRVTVGDMKINDTLLISLKSFGKPIAGFELKFAVESPFINIDTVLSGELYDSCRWQFFTARSVNTLDNKGYPPVLWQAVALARVVSEGEGPLCYSLDREASLARLVVSSEHISRIPDAVAPIFFFWEDCSDNSFSSISGDTLAISAKLFDFHDVEYQEKQNRFPNRTGALDECINPAARNKPRRLIKFHNGGVEFKLDLGDKVTDSLERGIER